MRVAIFTVGLNVFGFMAVAVLSGYLAEGLRRTGEQLEETSTQLADLQAFSQHVIDSLTSGLTTCDMAGRLLTFNRAAEGITAIAAVDALGRPMAEVLQLPQAYAGLFRPHGRRPMPPRIEYGYTRADGRQIELGISAAPLITPRGDVGFLFTFQDVTEAKKHEREARVQQRLAAVGEMAAGIAHEIRNPLASMAGSIQILRQELPLTPEQSQLMDIVLRESERLNDTIRSFLAYARPQRLSVRQDADAPGNPGRVVISVADEGVGIPPEEMDGIFQPFRGAFARGTGLGLSIVHRIVSDYGGEVQVTSERGAGTTVNVVL